jgi:hypothetical protein
MNFIRPNIAVCGFHEIGTQDQFARHGFHGQLQCAEAFDPWLVESIDVLALPFADGAPIPSGIFFQGQAWLAGHWDLGNRVLISCAAGASRSVTMASALLTLKAGVAFPDAVAEVMAKRPEANPHPVVLASASVLCGQPLTLGELRQVYKSQPLPRRIYWAEEMLKEAIKQIGA